MVLLSRFGCFICSSDGVFLGKMLGPAAGVLAPFRARACRPFRAPAPHTYIQVLRGWGLPPSPFKGILGNYVVGVYPLPLSRGVWVRSVSYWVGGGARGGGLGTPSYLGSKTNSRLNIGTDLGLFWAPRAAK